MKILSTIIILFAFINLSNCTGFKYEENVQKARDSKNLDVSDFSLDDITDLNLQDLADKATINSEGCGSYESGVPSFNLISDSLSKVLGVKNPIKQFKNCLAKNIDESLKPICIAEKNLDELEKKHRNDDQALDQIDQARYNLGNIKDSVVNQLWDFADSIDRSYEKRITKSTKKPGFASDLLQFVGDTEFGSLVSFFESKANKVCFNNLTFKNR